MYNGLTGDQHDCSIFIGPCFYQRLKHMVKDKINRFQLLKLLPKLFTGDHIKSPYVKYQQIKYLNINPKINELLNIDGEIYGTTPVSIDILNKKLPIFYDCIR